MLDRFVCCAAVLVFAFIGQGCTDNVRGGPTKVLRVSADGHAGVTSDTQAVAAKDDFVAVESKDERDKRIVKALIMIDQRYESFVQDLNHDRTLLDAGSGVAAVALGVAGTLTEATRAKTNLAAGAALLAGSTAVIDKTVFYEKTVSALVAAMDAGRSEVLIRIRAGMSQDVDVYRPSDAWRDLLGYERAGTLLGAVGYVQATSQTTADDNAKKLRGICDLTVEERKQKVCATRSLASTNAKRSLTALSAAAKALGIDGGTSADEIANALQDHIRDACPPEIGRIRDAFQEAALLSDCDAEDH
jgi:hypothetical protein